MTKTGRRGNELCYLSEFVDAPPCCSKDRVNWESTWCWDRTAVVGVGIKEIIAVGLTCARGNTGFVRQRFARRVWHQTQVRRGLVNRLAGVRGSR